jgi:hypothetical protein
MADKTPAEQEKELMGAVDTAVTAETPPDVQEAANDPEVPPAELPEAANDPEIEKPAEEPEKPAADTPPETPETPAEPEQPKAPDTPEAKKPDAAPQMPAEPDKLKKPEPDHVNDPIPDSVKGRTRERMESLVTTSKDLRTQLTAAKRDLGELYQAIEETRAPPKQFAQTLDALRGFNSRDPAERREAAKYFRTLADGVASDLGDTVPGKSPLDGHPDLKQRVAEREITEADANELAEARNRRAADERRSVKDRELDEQQRNVSEAHKRGIAELNVLGAKLYAEDPANFEKRNAAIMPRMKAMRDKLDPSAWTSVYEALYRSTGLPAAAAPAATKPGRAPLGTGAQQPLRPRPGAGGGAVQEPKSVEEAMELALKQTAASG